ncbi:hypothetical protein MesoLj131a_14420 [Mesorhizobium sp. 131-2-1]|nr:hypothetical protein MesoLj131a_14420 [Mesorhizobium sp. 131-2-1]
MPFNPKYEMSNKIGLGTHWQVSLHHLAQGCTSIAKQGERPPTKARVHVEGIVGPAADQDGL